jgi:hypothetical protein
MSSVVSADAVIGAAYKCNWAVVQAALEGGFDVRACRTGSRSTLVHAAAQVCGRMPDSGVGAQRVEQRAFAPGQGALLASVAS